MLCWLAAIGITLGIILAIVIIGGSFALFFEWLLDRDKESLGIAILVAMILVLLGILVCITKSDLGC